MRPARGLRWTAVTVALAVSAAGAASAVRQSRSVWIGVYTDAQARDGEALYPEHCAQCHGQDLAGVEQAPALAGGPFGQKWQGATLPIVTPPYDRITAYDMNTAELIAFALP
jgi:mono/diheme cytochrome c family protein